MNKRTEQKVQMIIAVLALIGLLAYTFVHTGSLMAQYIRPVFVGYMAAFGIELAVAGISFRLASLKRKQITSRLLLFILISALFVSALANIAEGYQVRYGKPLTWVNLGDIDYIQAVIGIAATGLISLMVFAISETIGVDVEAVVKQTEREQRQAEQGKQAEPESIPILAAELRGLTQGEQGEQPIAIEGLPQTSYEQAVYSLLDNGEPASPTVIAKKANTSKATASKWITAWQAKHQVNTNGAH